MGLIVITADKGAPGVTTAAVALAAVWPRPVLLAECDPAGGDIIYRLPSAEGGRLDPRRGLLSLAIAARRGAAPGLVWEHAQKLRGGLDVLVGVANAEQGAGLDLMWDQVGAALAAVPEADVIADCGRLGADSRIYDLLARADAVVLVTRAHLGDLVRLRDRAGAIEAAIRNHGGLPGRLGALVVADHKHFSTATADVRQVLSGAGCPVSLIGGLAHEPRSAEMLSGDWGGKLDKTMLIRTAREIAAHLASRIQPSLAQSPAAQSQAAQSRAAQSRAAQAPGAQPGAGQRGPAQPGPGQRGGSAHTQDPAYPGRALPAHRRASRPTASRATGQLPDRGTHPPASRRASPIRPPADQARRCPARRFPARSATRRRDQARPASTWRATQRVLPRCLPAVRRLALVRWRSRPARARPGGLPAGRRSRTSAAPGGLRRSSNADPGPGHACGDRHRPAQPNRPAAPHRSAGPHGPGDRPRDGSP